MQEEMLARGRELADRLKDQNLLIDAVQDKFNEWEVFVPMWMEVATSPDVIDKLEKETEFKHTQIKRWAHMLRNRDKFERKMIGRIWREWMR